MSKMGLAVIETNVGVRRLKCTVNLLTGKILDNPQNLSVTIKDGKVLNLSLGDNQIQDFVILRRYKVSKEPVSIQSDNVDAPV